jgi:hypothetical protein
MLNEDNPLLTMLPVAVEWSALSLMVTSSLSLMVTSSRTTIQVRSPSPSDSSLGDRPEVPS